MEFAACGGFNSDRLGERESSIGFSELVEMPSGYPTLAEILSLKLGLENFSVNCLFQANSRSWDVEVVRDLFSPEDAAIILRIPLNSGDADTWYWVAEKKCFYSVRSAYNLLQSLKHSSVFLENNEIWKKLWSLKVPPKAKDLVWRAASNCLATKVNLCTKKVLVENTCPLCGVFAETEWHILVSCNFPWSCWEFAGLAAASREVSSLGQCPSTKLVVGDFNATFYVEDRIGGKIVSPNDIEDAQCLLAGGRSMI
ncbi:hypothetical protein G4B88_014469 [Cannabis sativa]|uniref:Reverse transcriptase zinc-binding domain-containing protein n=1 Tax=Cannabis sativa TaxID=3483 RepID=A0A7J6I8Y8_CANSA|nr:hypothetical protein G4B88_014469 [Cannabis sativa]